MELKWDLLSFLLAAKILEFAAKWGESNTDVVFMDYELSQVGELTTFHVVGSHAARFPPQLECTCWTCLLKYYIVYGIKCYLFLELIKKIWDTRPIG